MPACTAKHEACGGIADRELRGRLGDCQRIPADSAGCAAAAIAAAVRCMYGIVAAATGGKEKGRADQQRIQSTYVHIRTPANMSRNESQYLSRCSQRKRGCRRQEVFDIID